MARVSGQSSRVAVVRVSQGETSLYTRKEARSLDPKEGERSPCGCMATVQPDHRRLQSLRPNHTHNPVPPSCPSLPNKVKMQDY